MKILFLTYYLDAENNVGAIRASKFIKYLQRQGHEVYVFSSEKAKLECKELQIKPHKKKGGNKFYQVVDENSMIQKVLLKIKVLVKDLIYSPDKQVWWNIRMLPTMISTVRNNNIDIAITTGSPFSTFVSLYFLKKICSIPIILDFRDPWKDSITMNKQSFVRKLNVKYWEKVCVKNADGIVVVNDSIAEKINDYKPTGVVQVITNGFDPEDFDLPEQDSKDGEFTFLYTGKYSILREDYDPTTVFEAFKQFKQSNPNDSVLRFIGPTDQETLDFAKDYEHFGIKCEMSKSRKEILQIQCKANIVIQFYYPQTYDDAISMKIYEYAYQKKNILSFNKKSGILFSFLKNNGIGFTASSHNIEEMSLLFSDSYEKKLYYTTIDEDPSELAELNYRNLTNNLYNLIKKIKKRVL